MISEVNVDSNNIHNENTKTERAIDEMTVVKVNETFTTDNRTARKKKTEDISTSGNGERGENCWSKRLIFEERITIRERWENYD